MIFITCSDALISKSKIKADCLILYYYTFQLINVKIILNHLWITLKQILTQLLQTILSTVVFVDFNAKLNLWCNNDVTTYECSKTDGLNYQFVLQQTIKNAFTFLVTVRLFVLIFTTHQNSVMESGVHSSLHSNCHHYITFAKSNLKIYYTPSYERHVWYY